MQYKKYIDDGSQMPRTTRYRRQVQGRYRGITADNDSDENNHWRVSIFLYFN